MAVVRLRRVKEVESENDVADDNDNVFGGASGGVGGGAHQLAPSFPHLRPFDDVKHRRATVSGGSPTLTRPSIMISDTDTQQPQRPKSYVLPPSSSSSAGGGDDDVMRGGAGGGGAATGDTAAAYALFSSATGSPIQKTTSLRVRSNVGQSTVDTTDGLGGDGEAVTTVQYTVPPQKTKAKVDAKNSAVTTTTSTTRTRSPLTSVSSGDSVFVASSRSTYNLISAMGFCGKDRVC